MDIQPITWDGVRSIVADIGYPHHQRIAADMQQLQQRYPNSTPFVVSGPSIPTLLLAKGPLYPGEQLQGPPIEFVVTFPPTYPEAFPVITIEPPPEGWVIRSHPHVGTDGQCFLTRVSSWGGGKQDLVACVDELQGALRNYPFQMVQAQPQRPSATAGLSNALFGTPQPQRQQQPPPQQQQQQYYSQPAPQASTSSSNTKPFYMPTGVIETLFVGSAVLSAKCTVAVTKAVVSSLVGGSIGGGSSSSNCYASQREEQQRAYEEQLRQQKAEADAIFGSVLTGPSLAPGTSITFPPHAGLGTVICGAHPSAPLHYATPAPPPLPPIMEPTPDEQHRIALQQAQVKQQQDQAREAAKPKPVGALGMGLKALATSAKVVTTLASKARDTVEDKVRSSEAEGDLAQFRQEFPAEAEREQLAAVYQCKLMLGDGTGHLGSLFITDYQLLWSLDVAHFVEKHPTLPPPAPIKINVPLQYVVTMLRGEAAGVKWIVVVSQDNSTRPFYDFRTGLAGKVGTLASASLSGTPYDRAVNWIDHKWRAITPVPSPQYAYGRPVPIAVAGVAPQQNQNRFF